MAASSHRTCSDRLFYTASQCLAGVCLVLWALGAAPVQGQSNGPEDPWSPSAWTNGEDDLSDWTAPGARTPLDERDSRSSALRGNGASGSVSNRSASGGSGPARADALGRDARSQAAVEAHYGRRANPRATKRAPYRRTEPSSHARSRVDVDVRIDLDWPWETWRSNRVRPRFKYRQDVRVHRGASVRYAPNVEVETFYHYRVVEAGRRWARVVIWIDALELYEDGYYLGAVDRIPRHLRRVRAIVTRYGEVRFDRDLQLVGAPGVGFELVATEAPGVGYRHAMHRPWAAGVLDLYAGEVIPVRRSRLYHRATYRGLVPLSVVPQEGDWLYAADWAAPRGRTWGRPYDRGSVYVPSPRHGYGHGRPHARKGPPPHARPRHDRREREGWGRSDDRYERDERERRGRGNDRSRRNRDGRDGDDRDRRFRGWSEHDRSVENGRRSRSGRTDRVRTKRDRTNRDRTSRERTERERTNRERTERDRTRRVAPNRTMRARAERENEEARTGRTASDRRRSTRTQTRSETRTTAGASVRVTRTARVERIE